MDNRRKIAIPDFYGSGEHIFEDQLGFDADTRAELRMNSSEEIFKYALDDLHYELGFYYPGNQTFYFVATMESPIQLLRIPRDEKESRFIGWQCVPDAYEFGEVLATFDSAADIWDNYMIDGKPMEEVIPASFILRFC